jgi:hypothetical protein
VDKPTQLFTKSEQEAQAEREAKAAAKIEREAKRIEKAVTPDGSDLVLTLGGYRERIKTLVTARKLLTDALSWGRADITQGDYPALIAAIAAKEGKTPEVVVEEAQKRADKRR